MASAVVFVCLFSEARSFQDVPAENQRGGQKTTALTRYPLDGGDGGTNACSRPGRCPLPSSSSILLSSRHLLLGSITVLRCRLAMYEMPTFTFAVKFVASCTVTPRKSGSSGANLFGSVRKSKTASGFCPAAG